LRAFRGTPAGGGDSELRRCLQADLKQEWMTGVEQM
jgi:hypothetical protein